MQYVYEVKGTQPEALTSAAKHVCTKWDEAVKEYYTFVNRGLKTTITIYDEIKKTTQHLNNDDDIEAWQTAMERKIWADKELPKITHEADAMELAGIKPAKDAINPNHYQAYFGGFDFPELQWLETKQYQNHWKNPDYFIAAVLMQADKYQSRLGKKDEAVQELTKAIWYLKFAAAYIKNGKKPIRIKDIDNILNSK